LSAAPNLFCSAESGTRTFERRWPDGLARKEGQKEPRREDPAEIPDTTYFDRSVTASAATAARTAATAAAAATLTGFGFVHLERTALKVLAIERLHGARRIRVRHFDESEPARATRITVSDEGQRLDGAVRSEQRTNRVFSRGEG